MSHNKEHLKPQFIEEFYKNNGLIAMTCGIIGISPVTYYTWQEKDPDFKEACEFILEKTTDKIKKTMYNSAIEDKHYPSMKYIIETRCFRQRENEIATKLDLQNQITDETDVNIKIAILKRSLAKAEAEKLSLDDAK